MIDTADAQPGDYVWFKEAPWSLKDKKYLIKKIASPFDDGVKCFFLEDDKGRTQAFHPHWIDRVERIANPW